MQDLSSVQMTLVWRSLDKGGRVLGVGDEHQGIYYFRGADASAVRKMVNTFKMTTLPLSVSFRCSKAVIRLAQTIVPEIEAAPWAPEGSTSTITDQAMPGLLETGDWILCRTNAPLVSICLGLIRNGVKAVVRGRDIAGQIDGTIKKIIKTFDTSDQNVPQFLRCMDAYRTAEVLKLLAENKRGSAQALDDRCQVISTLSEGVSRVSQISEKLQMIFSDNPKAPIVCSTIHKAKGQEADNIFLVRPEIIPHPMAETQDEKNQEQNLLYVAYTRAKKNFYTVQTTKANRMS
jgi:DNA helicase-2/ATP-dependent DNA helicase PcrA